jgi:hypothetical protein
VILDAIAPYTQMAMSAISRDLLVVIVVVTSGLMLLFFASYAHAQPLGERKVSDGTQVISVEKTERVPGRGFQRHIWPDVQFVDVRGARLRQSALVEAARRPGGLSPVSKQ